MSSDERPAASRLKLELLAEIAIGATTRVDLCRSVGPYAQGELLAVKRLQPELKDDPVLSKRFLDEVWMTSALHHENVVRVIGWGNDAGGSYLAVELVQGVSLARLMKTVFETGEDFTERLAVHIGTSIARGLGAAHDLRSDRGEPLSLIHRNLTPSNVLLGFQGDVKIADFGLAKAKQRLSSSTASSLPNRPTSHVSPEEVRGERVDHRSDLFSLGVILYEMLTRKLPFSGANDLETVQKIVREAPTDMLTLRPKLDRNLARTVMRCLEKDPDARWQGAHDVVRELGAWSFAHGWTDENDVALGRFVRRNGMRQMNWFERAIAGRAPAEPVPRPATSFPGLGESPAAPKPPRISEKSRAEITQVERPLPSRRRRADSSPLAGGDAPRSSRGSSPPPGEAPRSPRGSSNPGSQAEPAGASKASEPPAKGDPLFDIPTLFEEDSEELPTIAMRRSEMPQELMKALARAGESRSGESRSGRPAPQPPRDPGERPTTQRSNAPPPVTGGATSSVPGPLAASGSHLTPTPGRSKGPPPLPPRDAPRSPLASDPHGSRAAPPAPAAPAIAHLGGHVAPRAGKPTVQAMSAVSVATDWTRALDRIRLERETYLTAAGSMRESAKQLLAAAEDEEAKARKAEAAIAIAKEAQALAANGATQEARHRLEEALRMVGAGNTASGR